MEQHCIICGASLKNGTCVDCFAVHTINNGRIERVVEADGTVHHEDDLCVS